MIHLGFVHLSMNKSFNFIRNELFLLTTIGWILNNCITRSSSSTISLLTLTRNGVVYIKNYYNEICKNVGPCYKQKPIEKHRLCLGNHSNSTVEPVWFRVNHVTILNNLRVRISVVISKWTSNLKSCFEKQCLMFSLRQLFSSIERSHLNGI
jgi:hypothetical protein